jgi:TonB-linked SusC/RagA family outer membrane protein
MHLHEFFKLKLYKFMKKNCNGTFVLKQKLNLKTLLMMKFTVCFLLLGMIQVNASVFSQQGKFSVSVKESQIKEIFNEIESQSDYRFFYTENFVELNKKVGMNEQDVTIDALMNELLADTKLTYRIFDNALVVVMPDKTKVKQELVVKGKVTDSEGHPLPGVNIVEKGTTNGAVTDMDGNYTISLSSEDAVLTFSFVGYLDEEVSVAGKSNIDITLVEDIQSLDEVVVIGYGTAKKSDLTGSVSSVNTKDMNPGPVANVSSLMQNTVAGVVLSPSNAQPGGDYNIRIRGTTSDLASNEPLYVIDGFPIEYGTSEPGTNSYRKSPKKNPLNSLNPNDIVSIEILKDASATAIYGSRGANGVVLITTKQGEKGKMKVGYNYARSTQNILNQYEMAEAPQFANFFNTYIDYRNSLANDAYAFPEEEKYTPEQLAEIEAGGPGTNWMDEITRANGTINDHLITASGGNDQVTYYSSLGYYSHKGIVKETNMDRYSAKLNLTATPGDKLSLGMNFNGSIIKDDQINYGGGHANYGILDIANNWMPTLSPKDEDGNYTLHPIDPGFPNPVSQLAITDQIKSERALLTAWGEYSIVQNLSLKLEAGVDRDNAIRYGYVPKSTYVGSRVDGQATINNNRRTSELVNFLINYNKDFMTKSNFKTMLGFSYQNFDSEGFGAKHEGFAVETFEYNNLGAGSVNLPSYSYRNNHDLVSSFIRSNLILQDKYLLTFTARADGSSRFGENNKWAFFPSGAVAWKIHNEDFFNENGVLSILKLRTSYGLTGNQEIDNYRSLPLIGNRGLVAIGEKAHAGLGPTSPGNKSLKWETSKQFEVGVDYGLWNNRISGSVNYYNIITSDLLAYLAIPQTTGFSSIIFNSGKTQNTGVEAEVRSYNLTGMFKWETAFNFSYNKNQWKDRGGLPYGIEEEFGPVGGTYGYIIEGVFKTEEEVANSLQPDSHPGQWKFKDVNGRDEDEELTGKPDGQIDTDDRVLLGYWQPDYTLGLNNIFNYKNWQLNVFVNSMIGHNRWGAPKNPGEIINQKRLNVRSELVDLFDEEGKFDYDNPGMIPDGTGNPYANGGFTNTVTYEDASFVRLRNVTLSYNFSNPAIANFISNARLYVDVQNLYTITDYTGLDPEASGEYPNARTFTIGVNVDF